MLYVLPFDHRGSFHRMLFPGVSELSPEQHDRVKHMKRLIFESMKIVGSKRGYDDLAVLVDEQYGLDIHSECEDLGIRNILTIEKSGQDVFDFEYENWQEHLLKIKPTYAKALIRVTIGNDNSLQNSRLKQLGDFCSVNSIGFLIEPLIQPSEGDMDSVSGDKNIFDADIRPKRFAEAVSELHSAGVTPDVWKIEGTETKEAMDICSDAVHDGGKEGVQIVILGRGADMSTVDHWLIVGARSNGVTGFAVGRTIFAEAISKYDKSEISEEDAKNEISRLYEHCIDVFESANK